ncbi:MAG: KilA-N domain-containing protein [Oscillospiraceae bacterium]|nr:KilA-N domain-containing protein [Oscillospiraceae bacterium]
MGKLQVLDYEINTKIIKDEDYVSLTDLARYIDKKDTYLIINNWTRSTSTIEFLGLWEKLNNPNFKPAEFDRFRNESGSNTFRLPPQKWVSETNAIGIISKSGRYGGTFAHVDIALEFASWMSPEFRLYVMTEFKRLKTLEQKQLGWNLKRTLSKINYNIHTDAIKNNLIPYVVTKMQIEMIYADEADIINVALFGMTAKEWRQRNPNKEGNVRDYANVAELVCLVNLENLNSVYINEGIIQKDRLIKLNKIAIHQMKLLTTDKRIQRLEDISNVKMIENK